MIATPRFVRRWNSRDASWSIRYETDPTERFLTLGASGSIDPHPVRPGTPAEPFDKVRVHGSGGAVGLVGEELRSTGPAEATVHVDREILGRIDHTQRSSRGHSPLCAQRTRRVSSAHCGPTIPHASSAVSEFGRFGARPFRSLAVSELGRLGVRPFWGSLFRRLAVSAFGSLGVRQFRSQAVSPHV
jgi:hypothetical protein